jgi:hypothetical protein
LPQLAIDHKGIQSQYRVMAQHWTSRMTHSAHKLGRVFRTTPRAAGSAGHADDADARRMSADLDAIRARFPDHA